MNAPVRTVAVLMLAAAFQAAFAAGDAIRPLNSIAVEVNSSIITYGDIARMVKELRANPANKDIPDEQLSQAAKSRLVERTLLADAIHLRFALGVEQDAAHGVNGVGLGGRQRLAGGAGLVDVLADLAVGNAHAAADVVKHTLDQHIFGGF